MRNDDSNPNEISGNDVPAAGTEQLSAPADTSPDPAAARKRWWTRNRAATTAPRAKVTARAPLVLVAAAAGLLIGGLGGYGIGHADARGHHGMRSAEAGYSQSGHAHGGMRGMGGHRGMGQGQGWAGKDGSGQSGAGGSAPGANAAPTDPGSGASAPAGNGGDNAPSDSGATG